MKNVMKLTLPAIVLVATLLSSTAGASVIFSDWKTNEGVSGNYIVTLDDSTAGFFDITLTIDPWNAEALGLFLDFGASTYGGSGTISAVSTAPTSGGAVTFITSNTNSNSCGTGCNLNGLNPTLGYDDEWELVFRLADSGYDNIQTFQWTIDAGGLLLSDLVAAGARAQQLCDTGELLPDGNCDGSDKSFAASPDDIFVGITSLSFPVSAPGSLALLALGALGMGWSRRYTVRARK